MALLWLSRNKKPREGIRAGAGVYQSRGKLIITDVKVGSSFNADQLTDYGKLMEAFSDFSSPKGRKVAQYLLGKGIPEEALNNIEFRYIVLDGGKGDVVAQAAKIQEKVGKLRDDIVEFFKVIQW